MNRRLRQAVLTPVRPVLHVLQTRIDNAVRASDERHEADLRNTAAQLRAEQAAEAALQHRLRDERLGDVPGRVLELEDQLRRMSVQLVALERRVGDLERPPVALDAADADRREARSLIDEVRREHARTRADLAAVAFYEERIARLEQATDGERTSGVR